MFVNAMYTAVTFYSIQAMKVLLSKAEFGKHSTEKLKSDMCEYEKNFIDKLSMMLFDYSTLVVFGEMRHASEQCDVYIDEIPQGGRRSDRYQEALQYNPYNILFVGEEQFNKKWKSSFGGKKWALIAKIAAKKNTIDDKVYCDACFSLSHNTSPYLNKCETGIFTLSNVTTYKDFLDTKFKKTPEEILETYNCYQNYSAKTFIERLTNLQFADIKIKKNDCTEADRVENAVFNYNPINWGNKFIRTTFQKSKNNNKCDSRRRRRSNYDDNDYDDYEERERAQ